MLNPKAYIQSYGKTPHTTRRKRPNGAWWGTALRYMMHTTRLHFGVQVFWFSGAKTSRLWF